MNYYAVQIGSDLSYPGLRPGLSKLYAYGVVRNAQNHTTRSIHPSIALADYIKDIKVASSKWMKESGLFPGFNGWGAKYCALTYSYNEREHVISYIKNQQEHHKKESFQDEIKRIFKEQGIDLDEKWFWQDE